MTQWKAGPDRAELRGARRIDRARECCHSRRAGHGATQISSPSRCCYRSEIDLRYCGIVFADFQQERRSFIRSLMYPVSQFGGKRQKQEVNEFRITVLPCVLSILRERGYPGDAVGEAAPRRGATACAKRNFQCRVFVSRHVDSRVSQVSRSQRFFVVLVSDFLGMRKISDSLL